MPAKPLLFPPAIVWAHLETSLERVLPAILIHKDEDDGGNVTGPGAMPAGEGRLQPRGEGLAAARSWGYYRRLATSMPSTGTWSEQAWAWLPVRAGPLIYG